MKRITALASMYKCDQKFNKFLAAKEGYKAGFMAARKMCAVMGEIAHLEGKNIREEIMKVGEEEWSETKSSNPATDAPSEITGIINTLE